MKKRGLISAIAMLVVSAIVLTSATMAWFSMGKTVSVDKFSATVAKADGLMISADKSTWDTSITLTDIINAANFKNIVTSSQKMFPVSSNGTSTFYKGHLEGDNVVIEALESEETGYYYNFPVWIKYSGEGTISVDLTGTTVTATTSENANDEAAVKASRLTVFADGASSCKVYLPGGAASGLKYATATGKNPATTELSNSTTSLSDLTVSLTSGTAVKVWVVCWLEGYDVNCTDTLAAGGNIDVTLNFTKVE